MSAPVVRDDLAAARLRRARALLAGEAIADQDLETRAWNDRERKPIDTARGVLVEFCADRVLVRAFGARAGLAIPASDLGAVAEMLMRCATALEGARVGSATNPKAPLEDRRQAGGIQ